MASTSEKPNSVRQDLGEVITEVFSREWLLEFAEKIKGMTQGVWGEGRCPECDSPRKCMVQIPDIKGQLSAVMSLLEQAEGRPGTADQNAGGITIVVERNWPVAGTETEDDLQSGEYRGAGEVPPLESED